MGTANNHYYNIPVRRPTDSHSSWSENQVTNQFTNLVTVCVINSLLSRKKHIKYKFTAFEIFWGHRLLFNHHVSV